MTMFNKIIPFRKDRSINAFIDDYEFKRKVINTLRNVITCTENHNYDEDRFEEEKSSLVRYLEKKMGATHNSKTSERTYSPDINELERIVERIEKLQNVIDMLGDDLSDVKEIIIREIESEKRKLDEYIAKYEVICRKLMEIKDLVKR